MLVKRGPRALTWACVFGTVAAAPAAASAGYTTLWESGPAGWVGSGDITEFTFENSSWLGPGSSEGVVNFEYLTSPAFIVDDPSSLAIVFRHSYGMHGADGGIVAISVNRQDFNYFAMPDYDRTVKAFDYKQAYSGFKGRYSYSPIPGLAVGDEIRFQFVQGDDESFAAGFGWRITEFYLSGASIPAPSSVLALGLACMVSRRRCR